VQILLVIILLQIVAEVADIVCMILLFPDIVGRFIVADMLQMSGCPKMGGGGMYIAADIVCSIVQILLQIIAGPGGIIVGRCFFKYC